MPAEHSYPGLDVGAEDAETPQSGERGQQHREGERLQGGSETQRRKFTVSVAAATRQQSLSDTHITCVDAAK